MPTHLTAVKQPWAKKLHDDVYQPLGLQRYENNFKKYGTYLDAFDVEIYRVDDHNTQFFQSFSCSYHTSS